jgi:hypothetical protein
MSWTYWAIAAWLLLPSLIALTFIGFRLRQGRGSECL